jgi:saccharopine dehydrogenase (NAD+, L-lysine-forming)
MRVLLIGAGTVGEAIARLSAERDWCEAMVLADYSLERASALERKIARPDRFHAERVDARDQAAIVEMARRHHVDLVMNAVDPQFLMPIFEAALEAGVNYMDMATSLSRPHPTDPYHQPGVKLADEQFARARLWE